MSSSLQIDSCLRVASNRCRNLRKGIEKAKQWKKVADDGKDLNDGQVLAINAIDKKEAVLAELEEVLRKQQTVAKSPIEDEQKLSSKLAAKKSMEVPKITPPESDTSTSPRSPTKSAESSPENTGMEAEKIRADVEAEAANAMVIKELEQQMEQLKIRHNEDLAKSSTEAVRKALNLLHAADFLKETGSRGALLSYFHSEQGQQAPKVLSDLDMDVLAYFHVMLTTPNGNVPHNEAVDVSTTHCMEFLKKSSSEAFEGTSYAYLTEILEAITTCPLLAKRGVQSTGDASGSSSQADDISGLTNGSEQNHYVDYQATTGTMSWGDYLVYCWGCMEWWNTRY